MPNSFDLDGRGPSDRQLLGIGLAALLVAALVTGSLLLKSTGRLNDYVRVVAELVNVGDGLPSSQMSSTTDVLVGAVDDVIPAAYGKPNYVHIDLKPEYAKVDPRHSDRPRGTQQRIRRVVGAIGRPGSRPRVSATVPIP